MSGPSGYRGCRVLLLGGGGFIGRWVAARLLDAGADLRVTTRDPAKLASRRGSLGVPVEVDLSRTGAAADLVRMLRPSITFNLAGYGVDPLERDEALAARINHKLVQELAEASASVPDPEWRGQQLIHTGSGAEYGVVEGRISEATRPRPLTAYGRTKLAGTEAVSRAARSGALRAASARLFTVYGPGERPERLLPSLMAAARNRSELALTAGEQRRDFTYVGDVAEGLLRLGLSDEEGLGPINLATGRVETVRRFAERAAAVLGLDPGLLHFGALPVRLDDTMHGEVSVDRLRQIAGWVPDTSIEEGVRRTARGG